MAESDQNKKGAGKSTGNKTRRLFVQQAKASVRFEYEEDEPSTYDHDDSDEDVMTEVVCSDGKEGTSEVVCSDGKEGSSEVVCSDGKEGSSSAGPSEQQPDSNKKSGFMNFLHRFNMIVRNIMNKTAHSSWRKPQ